MRTVNRMVWMMKLRSLRKNYCGTVEIQWSPHPGRAGLSGYLVCMVHLVSLIQPHKPDRPNRPDEQDRPADFFSILLDNPPSFPGNVPSHHCSHLPQPAPSEMWRVVPSRCSSCAPAMQADLSS